MIATSRSIPAFTWVSDIPAEFASGPLPVDVVAELTPLNVPTDPTLLADWLRTHGVPVETWGVGAAQTVGKLARELADGDCVLFFIDGRLVRFSRGVAVAVLHQTADGRTLRLAEDRQVFTDGRENPVKRRGHRFVGEKSQPGETGMQTAQRALTEELGVPPFTLSHLDTLEKFGRSISFPGIDSWYLFDRFVGIMPDALYQPDGYVEQQTDKTVVFVWQDA